MFIPETIDLGQSEKYDLSIRIRPDGLMFSIADPDTAENFCLRNTTFSEDSMVNNIQRIIFDLNFLTQQFRKTSVLVVSKNYNIVPTEYLNDKEIQSLYDFVNFNKTNHLLTHQNIQQQNITLFDIDTGLYEFLMRSLYNPVFLHHTNPLITRFQNWNKAVSQSSRMIVNYHDDMMDIFCFSPEKLILSQTYQGEQPMNQLYYILKVWEYCHFDQQEEWLYIVGEPPRETMSGLQKYILNIETSNFPTEAYLWNEDAQKAPLDLLLLAL